MATRARSSIQSWGAVALALLILVDVGAQSLNTQCYHKMNGVEHVTSPGGGPCGVVSQYSGFLSCCSVGDQCVEGGLCHFTPQQKPGSNESGYYVGGCTDPSLADPHCNPGCENLPSLAVIYDSLEKQWLCCGVDASGNVTCDNPTTETVAAVHLATIATTYVVPSMVATTSATAAPSSSSSSSSIAGTSTTGAPAQSSSPAADVPPTQSSTQHTSHTGAIAGGVVGGLAFIALVAAAGYFWYRRRRTSTAVAPRRHELATEGYYAPLEKPGGSFGRHERHELGTPDTSTVVEMDGLSPRDGIR